MRGSGEITSNRFRLIKQRMATEYKTYTIVEDSKNPYARQIEYMFYPTCEGVQHDMEYVNESWRYCGNCKWESSLEEAKAAIDDILETVNN